LAVAREATRLLRGLRENGPVVLVPLAWTFATAAHVGALGTRPTLVGHLVMDVVIVAFTVLSWSEMDAGVLLAWRRVLVTGLGFTLLGTVTLATAPDATAPLAVTVPGWVVVPGAGLAYTGRHVERAPRAHLAGAALCGVGAAVYAAGLASGASAPLAVASAPVAGLALVGVGQTAGIVAAVVGY
jgi:hypothetical protein